MLDRLLNELQVLYRCEARFHVPARIPAGELIIDHLYHTFGTEEPPIPVYADYTWPKTVQTFND